MPVPYYSPTSPAHAVSLQFISRPSLETVARQLLGDAIKERYPTLVIDLLRTRLGSPQSDGSWTLRPLMEHVLEYLATGIAPNFDDVAGQSCFLADQPPTQLKLPISAPEQLEMSVIAGLIRELPWALPMGLQDALTDYWQATTENGVNRWRWLADLLLDTLRTSALRHPQLDALERDSIDQLIQVPDRDNRLHRYGESAVYAYCLQTTLTGQGRTANLLGPELLLVRVVGGRTLGLLCKPDGSIERVRSLDTFAQTWGRRIAARFNADTITSQRYEPDGNLFDTQAALILNQQLENLGALQLPARQPLATLNEVYRQLTDPGLFFLDSLQAPPAILASLKPRLPDWLSQASGADQMRYRQYCLQLASAKKRSAGRTFLSDISDIRSFAVDALWQQMKRDELTLGKVAADQSQADHFKPDDLELSFAVAAGYPDGAGIIEHRTLTLTELALKNLAGKPRGQATLRHRHGKTLPVWLTADYINRLVGHVDIGKTYPALLENLLLGDTPQVSQRETWFADQLAAQLPLQALELALKPPHVLSNKGAQMVAALLQTSADERRVDGEPVVIRSLALLRKPEAAADGVNNMFIIEAQNIEVGPHLLYRPLYADSLMEFATRQALLDAIAKTGELQTSVLTWLPDSARTVYDNGGFQEPHYVRFGQGDEFTAPNIPRPASLATDGASDELLQCLLNGRLYQYLYGSYVRALVVQADRDSVSNSESRWAVLLEGGGLLFNSLLLPWLRGPAMLTGWLLALMTSASQDIPALNNPDPVTRELAAVDTLLNLGMLLLHLAPAPAIAQPAVPRERLEQALKPPIPRRQNWPVSVSPSVEEGTVALYGHWPGASHAPLDFSFANPRNQLTSIQRERLARLKVTPPATLPAPIASGPDKGLYLIEGTLHALIDGDLFKVSHEPDGRVIVDPADIRNHGPYLRLDHERWVLDLRLRLRGGMLGKKLAAERQRKTQRKQELQAEYNRYLGQQATEQRRVDLAENLWIQAQNDPNETAQERISRRRRFDTALQQQVAEYEKILATRQEREQLMIALSPQTVVRLMENTINNARKSVVFAGDDRAELYSANVAFTVQGPRLTLAVITHQREYLRFIEQLIEINARQIRWLELKDQYLDALFNMGEAGAETYTRLTANRPTTEYSALAVKNLQLRSLKFPSLKEFEPGPSEALDSVFDTLQLHVRTHSELNALDLPPDERLEVLGSLVEHYGKALDALKGIGIVNADELFTPYFNQLLKLVEELYQDAARQLAIEVKPDPQPRRRPPKRPMVTVGRPVKKVIKTRKGMMIGELKPAGTSLPVDVVEVRTEDTGQLLSSYSQHEDVWDEIRVVPAAATPQPKRSLFDIRVEANQLLKGLDDHLNRANSYLTVTRHPQELEEVLQHEANRLLAVADELEHTEGKRTDAERTQLESLRFAALQLNTRGKDLRIRASLQLPPTHGNLEYLLQEDQVQIASLGARLQMRGEQRDFIQEYAINDKRGFPLWYAHFHYPSATTPKQNYSAAHLKTRAQRKQSYQSLLSNAHDPQSIVNVHRGLIGKALAERHFLPLAP
jgi:hypothetical protein